MKRFFDPRNKSFSRLTALFGVLLFFVFGVFFAGHGVFAADGDLASVGEAAGLAQTSLPILIARIIRAVIGVLGILVVIRFVYAGYLYMISKGDGKKIEEAKKIMIQTVIGLVIVFSSYSIASFILSRLLAAVNGPGTIVSIAKKYVEPLAGSLGAGIIESHYPVRNASGISRNTKIFVTFKEPIKADTIIDGFKAGCTYVVSDPQTNALCSTNLKANAVSIFETAKGEATKLAPDKVKVMVSEDFKTFVFKSVVDLGNAEKDTSYTVALKPSIQKENGGAAFVGVNSAGYGWNFSVSTGIDLTPPKIISIIPSVSPLFPPGGTVAKELDRNISVEITFNEPMDPIASTGTYKAGDATKNFQRISVTDGSLGPDGKAVFVDGTYDMSNAYKTVGFTTTSWCGKDPCGGDIYCLPGNKQITVNAKAASVDKDAPPQGVLVGVNYDGLVDASGNSLDGNNDGDACQSAPNTGKCQDKPKVDEYSWKFSTNNSVNTTVPKIESLLPDMNSGDVDVSKDLTLTFNTLLKASTVNSTNVSVWPDPFYAMWFSVAKSDVGPVDAPGAAPTKSVVSIGHPTFISASECGVASGTGNCNYWPVVTHEVKSAYQICMFPSMQSSGKCTGADATKPYCCNGEPSDIVCQTDGVKKQILPMVPAK